MSTYRRDTLATPKKETVNYRGENHINYNFQPLATDSTWQELIDYAILLRDDYNRIKSHLEEVCQALLDRYDGGERTSELKEEMRTIW